MCSYLSSKFDIVGFDWDDRSLPAVKGCDAVVHLGAISSTTERDVNKVLRQNLDFSQWLFTECAKHDVPFQYASSASVYGNGLDFNEAAPPAPLSPYAWSKYLFDCWVTTQSTGNIVQGFRYFNVYGPHEDHKRDQASPVHKFQRQATENGVIKIFEGSEIFKRDFVFVGDICNVHEKMLSEPVNGLFNVGTGKAVSFLEVAQSIATKFSCDIMTIKMPSELKPQYQRYTEADIGALSKYVTINWTSVTEYIDNL